MRNRTVSAISAAFLSFSAGLASSVPASPPLTIERRVEAQRALEQVYWNHRVWPESNPQPKPPLSAVIPDAALRVKVEDSLRKSSALEAVWGRPITAAQLQAEMARMVRESRSGEVLAELFAALSNDPALIAETLVRERLADRLIRNWFAYDDRFHGDARAQAEAALAKLDAADSPSTLGGEYRTARWQRGADGSRPLEGDTIGLDADEWAQHVSEVAAAFDARPENLPVGRLSRLDEQRDAFVVTEVLARGEDSLELATVSWPKQSFDAWWSGERGKHPAAAAGIDGDYVLAQVQDISCSDDTWSSIPSTSQLIERRSSHSAVWTGSEMIVWGGWNGSAYLSSGVRYDPATDTWKPIATGTPATPAPRSNHTAVWTGSEMIVWGGGDVSFAYSVGGRYNPTTDTWLPTSASGAPGPRLNHTAVWTGTAMIVWGGGLGPTAFDSGGRYSPTTDTWQPTASAGAPSSRQLHSAVWTGNRMIVWGGRDGGPLNTGARYDPVTDTWQATSIAADTPSPRFGQSALWTGSSMIVWGGEGAQLFNTGARYDPSNDSWQVTETAGAPLPRRSHSAVWTGSQMLIWGGYAGNQPSPAGARYDPVGNVWVGMATFSPYRTSMTTVWTGAEMIVWGGRDTSGELNTGGRYDPVFNRWVVTSLESGIAHRQLATAVWTGNEMIVWGGVSLMTNSPLASGGRYDPATATWVETALDSWVPSPRYQHSAVWTGLEMIVWGGSNSNTGSRYDPSTNSWSPTSTGPGALTGRVEHTAVWTGSRMLVWGGARNSSPSADRGAAYDPAADAWTPISVLNAPTARFGHTAVWTGTRMLVWGGNASSQAATGGQYEPALDRWFPMLPFSGPQPARDEHTAVWTGREMIIWGGCSSGCGLQSGGRYDPATDTWANTPLGPNAPSGRARHTAVWTGTEMIIWGGLTTQTGGRYDPMTNSWKKTSVVPATPSGRSYHSAVWTGWRMLVFGGSSYSAGLAGGAYCAACGDPDADGLFCPDNCPAVANPAQENADGDPAGDACDCSPADGAVYPGALQRCDGIENDCLAPTWPTVPASERDSDGDGYLVCAGDCQDTNPAIHPGAAETCNGVDDDCDSAIDPASPRYLDSDGDGWGNPNDWIASCPPLPGRVTSSGDCDDSDPARSPGATEIPCNGVDENCDFSDATGPDTDHDQIPTGCDNCPTVANPSQTDFDADAIGDACDNCAQVANEGQENLDADERGDLCDNCPAVYNHEEDFEGDGVGDVCDNCPFDPNRSQANFDADFEGDACDLNDGLILLFRAEPAWIEWRPEQGFDSFNVYEGDLAVLAGTSVYTQAPGSNPLAQRTCGVADAYIADPDNPPVGKVHFSLVTGTAGGVEGTLGTDGAGAVRPNTQPCPAAAP